MALRRKEKTILVAVIAVVFAAAAWHVIATYIIPQVVAERERVEALEQQTVIQEGTTFPIEGNQDASTVEYGSNMDFSGTLSACVEGSRLYKSKTAMYEAEGFEGSLDEISNKIDQEPMGLVVDVSITNVDATNSYYKEVYGVKSSTYFVMNFNIGIGDGNASYTSYYHGPDLHVPEYDSTSLGQHLWDVVDIPQGETVTVRLAFLLPPAGVTDETGMFGRFIPAYEEGEHIYFYYGQIKYTSAIESLGSIGGELETTSFANAAAYIPYLVELSPKLMWEE